MTGYTKLFQTIITSSIWNETDSTRIVWITMLALCNQYGIVEASVSGLAVMARVPKVSVEQAIDKFLSPDPDSRSEEFEGRRIEKVDGGWHILNHDKYRKKLGADERREYLRIKKAEYRKKEKDLNAGLRAGQIVQERTEAELKHDTNGTDDPPTGL